MAEFITTAGISYRLEQLIKNTKDKLILVSPYLQFNRRVKINIEHLVLHKKDIRIIYRHNKLKIEESSWLEKQTGLRASFCKSLHAKCYLNETEAIVTSMNLYEYSQENNDEMGIYLTKENDAKLYSDIYQEVDRLLQISEEIRVSVKKVDKKLNEKAEKTFSNIISQKINTSSKLVTTKQLSDLTGLSSRKINNWFSDNKLMYKKEGDWITTKKGQEIGGIEKEGQWGKFIIWPSEISKNIK